MTPPPSAKSSSTPIRRQTTLLIGGSNGTATLCAILCDKSKDVNQGHVVRVATRSADKYLESSKQKDGATANANKSNDSSATTEANSKRGCGGSIISKVETTHGKPRVWRCQEKIHFSDVVPATFLPTKVVTHVGAPDSVFIYSDDDGNIEGNVEAVDDSSDIDGNDILSVPKSQQDKNVDHKKNQQHLQLSPLEKAISGIGAPDNGGSADIIILCCPVSAHLSILRLLARAFYKLNAMRLLGSSYPPNYRPPILIGTLYGAGGFDWMARIAFAVERPSNFNNRVKDGGSGVRWERKMGLFALRAFPYLCKSLEVGEVTLHGRFSQLQVAVTPSDVMTRRHAICLLGRVLQNETTGKELEVLGLGSKEELGGDGTVEDEDIFWSSYGMMMEGMGNCIQNDSASTRTLQPASSTLVASMPKTPSMPPPPILSTLLARSISDQADPASALGFLACTLHATNQILHPCILVALFRDLKNPRLSDKDGTIEWDTTPLNPPNSSNPTSSPVPRFYADGAAKPEAGQLITAIAGGEMYFVLSALEELLCPRGFNKSGPMTALHGGEPLGRKVMNFLGNSPRDLGERSGLIDLALKNEWNRNRGCGDSSGFAENDNDEDGDSSIAEGQVGNKKGFIRRENVLASLMSYGLSHNGRLSEVLSPIIVVQDKDTYSKTNNTKNENGTILIKPNPTTRFFTDDVQHGLCVYLGLAELLGFDLERDMKNTLYVVRRLQRWMGQEFVLPSQEDSALESRTLNGSNLATDEPRAKRVNIVGDARDVGITSAPQAFGINTVQDLKCFLLLDVFGDQQRERAEGHLRRSGLVSRL